MRLIRKGLAVGLALLLVGCSKGGGDVQADAQAFIDAYTAEYMTLQYDYAKADWRSNTMIVEGDTTNAHATRMANEALAEFTGSSEVIENARKFLNKKKKLTPIQVRQLEKILYNAADNPQTVEALVKKRIAAETKQNEDLFGFDFKVNGQSVTTNQIDEVLRTSDDLDERLANWEASKQVGAAIKDGLVQLRDLRNETVQALGYDDYFAYQVSDYGMTTDELLEMMRKFDKEIWPLYRELHTYARYTRRSGSRHDSCAMAAKSLGSGLECHGYRQGDRPR